LGHSLSPPIPGTAVSGHALSRSTRKQPDRAHVASMPDTIWPIDGHPPDSSREQGNVSVSVPSDFVSTLQRRSSSRPLPDTSLCAFSHIAHHDSLQLTQQWVVWSLPPQGGSGGPTSISRAAPHHEALPTSSSSLRSGRTAPRNRARNAHITPPTAESRGIAGPHRGIGGRRATSNHPVAQNAAETTEPTGYLSAGPKPWIRRVIDG
jgi:hypothetical protein